MIRTISAALLVAVVAASSNTGKPALSHSASDSLSVAQLDEAYQAAVERNDVAGMDSILMNDFTLVVGSGKVYRKHELIESARAKDVNYEKQSASQRTVRVTGSTAVVTALLWEKGSADGKTFDKKLWFSDTYVKTPKGWRYFFGQASLALP